ncbi:MAG TPA: DUF1707 domain-containing protein [Pseudonocardiaceae bacterium]|nr:DUF1707 domain-containing protein [Pseudonocardiaceae bacterium]
MSLQPEQPKPLDLRASDADRERVAKILHDAMAEGRLTVDELDERLQTVYKSKTLGELVPVTADLPGINAAAMLPQVAPQNLPSNRIGGTPGATASFALMSGFERTGNWVVPRFHTAFAMMGGGRLDLTEARFAEAETTIQAVAFMGGIEIIVPEDITVKVQGFGFMGGFDHHGSGEGPPGAPVVTINGFAMMGGVEVKRPKRKKNKRNRDALEQ